MPLINLIIVLIVIGVILYLVNTFIPMAPPIKTVINMIVVIVLCLWLLNLFGIGNLTVPVHQVRP